MVTVWREITLRIWSELWRMVCQMWIPVVPAAGLQVLKVWEVGAARQEVGGARVHHPDQVVPVETLMIQAIGLVNIALLPMSGPPLFARFASNGGKPHFHNTEVTGHVGMGFPFLV